MTRSDIAAHPDPGAALRRDGYVVFPRLLTASVVQGLVDGLESGGYDDPRDNPLTLGTMSFASNVYRRNAHIREFLTSDVLVDLLGALVGPDTWVRWDQAVWKRPGAPEFPMHQDNGYSQLATEHLQIWVALTACDEANGGLRVVPGGHLAPLDHRWVGHHLTADPEGPQISINAEIGDVVAFSSWLPHATPPNTTDGTRLAYVAEFLPLEETDPGVPAPHFICSEGGKPSARWSSDR